jgi:acyl dehydratase
MTVQSHPAITDEMRARIGVESKRTSDPVDKTLIRIWAISMAWPEAPDPLYWDEEYAKKTKFGGIVAPPYFSPFSYQMTPERVKTMNTQVAAGQGGERERARPGGNGGGEAEYFNVPIRPGDVITATSKVADIYVREGRTGQTMFTVTENRWTNQKGELVRVYRGTGFQLLGRG